MFRQLNILVWVLCLLGIFHSDFSTSSAISPDSKRLYHDIVSGHGLYHGFTKLTEFSSSNFKSIVFNEEKGKLWLVEFYNSWCGHCHRFAPTWKTLASDIFEWRDVIGVGAVDCANDANNQLCRDLEIMYYPMIKLFPPNSTEKYLGEDFKKGTVDEMRQNLVSKFRFYKTGKDVRNHINLTPVSTTELDKLWDDVSPNVKYVSLLFEPEDSLVGTEVLLDLASTSEMEVRLVNPSNYRLGEVVGIEQGTNSVVVVERDNTITSHSVDMFTREEVNKALRHFLLSHGVTIAPELPIRETMTSPDVNISDVMRLMQMEEDIKNKLNSTSLSTVVFQLDLEGAIRYSLRNEIPLHRNISGERFIALKMYINILIKYFPFGRQGVEFLKKLKEFVFENKSEINGENFRQKVIQLDNQFKPFMQSQGWIGCQGSQLEFRGYPCSLWTMFHTLTVHEELRDRSNSSERPEVLHAMAGYVKNFFTCSECAGHFTEMAKTISGNVTTLDDGIMWLWAAHNRVNKRLAGDQTEDPKHPKIQFPSVLSCPSCYLADGEWNKNEVLTFLKNMFSDVVYLQISDLAPTTTSTVESIPFTSPTVGFNRHLKHEAFGDEHGFKQRTEGGSFKKSLWGFNHFDLSLCVVLYVSSAAIMILVCLKFVFKKSYRKKTYVHDSFSKV